MNIIYYRISIFRLVNWIIQIRQLEIDEGDEAVEAHMTIFRQVQFLEYSLK